MGTYNTSVDYYRINANNTSIATSTSGASNSPTEEINSPVASSGTFASLAGLTITGSTSPATNFDTTFTEGQYLYYIDALGGYVLVGQIDTITDFNTLDVVSVVNNPATAGTPILAASYSLVTTSESIYIRVATDKTSGQLGPDQAFIPNLSFWRTQQNAGAPNNPNVTKLDRVSAVGVPASNATASPVQFTLEVMNTFIKDTASTSVAKSWNTKQDIPDYIWLKASVLGGNNSLSAQTLYRWTTEETVEALVVSPAYPNATLIASGYYNVTTSTSGGGGTGGNQ